MGNGITPEPWTTSIEFTVTPTDDPRLVTVNAKDGPYPRFRDCAETHSDFASLAARAYFDAHPNLPKKGQYISATRRNGTVCEGTVTRELDGDYRGVDLDGAWAGYLPHTNDTNRGEFPHDILSWTLAEPPKPAHPLADAKVAAQAVTAERAKVVAWLDGQSFGKRLLAIKDPVTPIEYNQSATNMGAAEALKRASRAIQAGAHDGGAES